MQVHERAAASELGCQRIDDLAWRIDAEFREMPGMRLTFAQVKRLWNLSNDQCSRVLDFLTSTGFLAQDEEQRFYRSSS
jgi:hypothetical protein